MLIDRSHRSWAIGTAALLIFAGVLYLAYAAKWPGGPSGRTYPGILFGVVGTFLMAFAGAIAIRKKTITARAGSLSWWLKGHIWLGALSVPMILFHAAFRVGGTLEIIFGSSRNRHCQRVCWTRIAKCDSKNHEIANAD